MKRVAVDLALAALLALAGCSADTIRETKGVDIASTQSPTTVASCIEETWARAIPGVTSSPYAGGRTIKYVQSGVLQDQVDVTPTGTGSAIRVTGMSVIGPSPKVVSIAKGCV